MDIKDLKQYSPIYIIGHAKPDADTALSSKVLADILNDYGIKSYYAVLDSNYDIGGYDKKMIYDCLKYNPVIIKASDINNYNYFLVDHNDPIQSVGDSANIIGCIDHHVDSNKLNKNKVLFNYCSTALSIYKLFKDQYKFSKEQLYQLYLATLSDSIFYKSSRFEDKDKELVDTMGFDYDVDALFKKYFETTDLSKGMNVAFNNGNKKHNIDGVEFESSYIEAIDNNLMPEYIKHIEEYSGNFLGRWINFNEVKTYVYFKYNNHIKYFEYNIIASRATTVMKDIIKYLNGEKEKRR
jgi:inorganic pyrophosphatase/exopolyphosphatase